MNYYRIYDNDNEYILINEKAYSDDDFYDICRQAKGFTEKVGDKIYEYIDLEDMKDHLVSKGFTEIKVPYNRTFSCSGPMNHWR